MIRWLGPRAFKALVVIVVSTTLLLLFTAYGPAEALSVGEEGLGFPLSLAAAFLDLLGAGAYALVLVPLIWAVDVFFRERSTDLHLRAIGTVLLAVSTACLIGILNGGEPQFWAGTVGSAYGGWIAGLGTSIGTGIAGTLGWVLVLFFWLYSLALATDWVFHALRRGDTTTLPTGHREIAVEPLDYGLLEDESDVAPRGFVAADATLFVDEDLEAEMAEDAGEADVPAVMEETAVDVTVDPAPAAPPTVPSGWSTAQSAGRTVLRAPTGYQGVEFLPPSDELAEPDAPVAPEPAVATDFLVGEAFVGLTHDVDLGGPRDEPQSPVTEQPTDEVTVTADDLAAAAAEAAATLAAEVDRPAAPSIGYPEPARSDDLLVDEVFSMDRIFAHVQGFEPRGPSDGVSAAEELVETFAPPSATPRVEEPAAVAPAPAVEEPVQPAPVPQPVQASEPVIPGDVLLDDVILADVTFHDVPLVTLDDVVVSADARPAPAPPAQPAVAETAETVAAEVSPTDDDDAPLPLFAGREPESSAVFASQVARPDVGGLHGIGLDPLFRESVGAILSRGRASAVVLQSHLGIGYSRANRILDQMTEIGVTGPETATGSREIRLPAEALESFLRDDA